MKTLSKKLLSLLLTIAFTLQLLPAVVFAEEQSTAAAQEAELFATERSDTDQEVLASAQVLFEEESLRERDVKHFRLDDGSYVAIRYGTAVHYEENGQWIEYDNTLRPMAAKGTDVVTAYRVDNGDSVRIFAADANAEVLLAVQKGNYSLGLSPIREPDAELPVVPEPPVMGSGLELDADHEAVPIPAELLVAAAPAEEEIADPFLTQVQPEKLYSALEYPAVLNGATLRYENYGNTIKESIIISAPQTDYSYSFTLQTDGLIPELQTDGSVYLFAADGAVIYAIPAPYMIDANNEYSGEADYSLAGSDGLYTLTVTADAQWLNAEDRAFPVLLDPTIAEYAVGEGISATFVRQGSGVDSTVANYPDPDRGAVFAGELDLSSNPNGLTRSYFHVDNSFMALPAGSEVILANLYLCQFGYSKKSGGSNTLELGIYALDKADGLEANTNDAEDWEEWARTLVWADVVNPSKTSHSPILVDKQTVSFATQSNPVSTVWDITSMAYEWYLDEGKNLGFVLKATDESTVSSRAAFYSPDMGVGKAPAMVIVYRNAVGLESYYSYQTVGIGRAGTAYIGDFTLQNTLVTPLAYSDSNVMPFSLSLIYNSAYENRYFGEGGGMHTKPFTTMQFGAGWKLSAQETVIQQALPENLDIPGEYCLIHTDADGTEHYYYYDEEPSSDGNVYYIDEDGLDLKIRKDGTDFYMTDDYGNTKYFGNGFLKSQTDAYGNKISYQYNGAQQLVSITRENTGKDVETLVSLSYYNSGENDPNFLKSITDEAGRTTYFDYNVLTDPNGNWDPVTCLSSITFPDGKEAEYNYFSNTKFYRWAKMKSARDSEANYGIEFSYSYNRAVRNIYEYVLSGANPVYGAKMHGYKRSRSQTTYRYYGDDGTADIDENDNRVGTDDILTTVIQDRAGRTVSSYSTDSLEETILGVGAAAYTQNSGTSKQNNRLTHSASAGQQGINLLKNASMEDGNVSVMAVGYWEDSGNAYVSADAYLGNIALAFLRKSFSATTDVWYQDVILEAGETYTFSAYVSVPEDATFSDNGGIYLAFRNSSSTELKQSEIVNYSTASIGGGWIRLSLSYQNETNAPMSAQVAICAKQYSGILLADACQMELGTEVSTFNLVEDGSFEHTSSFPNSSAVGWYKSGNSVLDSNEPTFFGNQTVKLSGSGYQRISRSVPLNVPLDTTFLFSGWAKGAADPSSVAAKTEESEPYFGLVLRFYYSDNSSEVHYYPFDTYYTGWQYIQGIAVPEKDEENVIITSVTIVAAYDNNNNAAYIDNLSFRMEPVQTYKYDEEGNLKSTAQTGTGSDASEYDGDGIDLLKYTAANGTTFDYTYNAAHDVTSATSDGVTGNYSYDALGNVTETTLTDGTRIMYSAAAVTADGNHTASVTNVAGKITTYTYDPTYGYLTQVVNANSQTTLYEYDNNTGRNTKVIGKAADGTELGNVAYTYTNGQLTALTRTTKREGDTQTQVYNFAYNIWGQSTSVKVGDRTLASYIYEDINAESADTGGGLMSQMTYGNGNSVKYFYDTFDRLVEMLYNDTGNHVKYIYNAEGALAELRYLDVDTDLVASYQFEYDSLGRLIRSAEYNAGGQLVQRTEHLYDDIGRLSSQTWVVGGDSFSESYVYNDPEMAEGSGDGSLSQMTTATGATIDFHYDGLKRLESRAVKLGSDPLYAENFTYYNHWVNNANTVGTLVAFHEIDAADGTELVDTMYSYDALGNITLVARNQSPDYPLIKYYYDDQNQLIREDHYDGLGNADSHITDSYTYTYDTAGNILTESKNGTVTRTYTYGDSQWNDLLTSYNGKAISYDSAGNPTNYHGGSSWQMSWSHGRSLTEATRTTTALSGKTVTTLDHAYDADGIRTRKVLTVEEYEKTTGHIPDPDPITPPIEDVVQGGSEVAEPDGHTETTYELISTTTETHEYITQNGKVVRETITSGDNVKVLDFIYDESGKPFALIYTNGSADSVTYYYVLNLQGDVVGLIDVSGEWVAEYTYSAWGEITQIKGRVGEDLISVLESNPDHIANINPLRYRGYYYDTETGFYYLQSRYYDPATHRFINADKHTGTGQGFLGYNMFAYCLNNPVMYVDYDGEDIEVTIYTREYEFAVYGGTVTVKYSLKGRIGENDEACVRFEPDNIEYEFFGGPSSIIIADKMDSIESNLSATLASYETEYGSISAAFSTSGASITTTNELGNGFFEEITFGFKPNNDQTTGYEYSYVDSFAESAKMLVYLTVKGTAISIQIGVAAGIAGVVVAGCGAAAGIFEPGSNRYRWKLGF